MTKSFVEFIPARPAKDNQHAQRNLHTGFAQLRFCAGCRRRRSVGQFAAGSDKCKTCS